jgi:hypothetical protein
MFATISGIRDQGMGVLLLPLLFAALLPGSGCAPSSYQGEEELADEIGDVEYLESYGEWFEVPPYGMVWQPFVVSDWSPFSHGHWLWTADGWAWVSYEPFGWLVYHYGFWDYRREIGWFWIPGDAWSPARVEWYTFDDYAAWAPLPPPDVYWPAPWEPYDADVWVVVGIDQFTDDDVGSRRISDRLPRELAERGSTREQPPDIRIIRERENRRLDPVPVRREPTEVRPQRPAAPEQRTAPPDSSLDRMILPREDERKVDKYAPEVRREILTPRKPEQPHEQKPAPPPERLPSPPPEPPEKKQPADSVRTLKRR